MFLHVRNKQLLFSVQKHGLRLKLEEVLSLTVEFFRAKTSDCTYDNSGQPISLHAQEFPYGNATCGLACSTDQGPYSAIRNGSTNNVYVIPAPTILTLGGAILIAAGSCFPAIFLLLHVWNGVFRAKGKPRVGNRDEDVASENPNGVTIGQVERNTTRMSRISRNTLGLALFLCLEIALLFLGELNFFSPQVYYETEPMTSVGRFSERPFYVVSPNS